MDDQIMTLDASETSTIEEGTIEASISESDDRELIGTATYSPEDNKLRLYPFARLDASTYARVKEAGFSWAPKQELFVAPMWTPSREDLLIELCGEIGDEDTSLVERAEERAERFEDLSEKRGQDAERAYENVSEVANAIPLGQPILVGHHSERRARKDAERIKSGIKKAVSMWETSKYWEDRAKGAIRHAKYKERPDVRARRIKGIEADLRKSLKTKQQSEIAIKLWSKPDLTHKQAETIANYDHISACFTLDKYPRELPASQYEGSMSLWSALNDNIITAEQAASIAIPVHQRTIARHSRWIAHYENRLTYERAMLGEQGGLPTDRVKPEKGGAVKCWAGRGNWIPILKVNRVTVVVLDNWGNGGKDYARTIPLDKVTAVLSKADYEAYKAGCNQAALAHDLEQAKRDAERSQAFRAEIEAEENSVFGQMKESLRHGVQVVSAPQLFPTPVELAERMVELAEIEPGNRILEPSAGTGNLLTAIDMRNYRWKDEPGEQGETVAVELNVKLASNLKNTWPLVKVKPCDFLECNGDLGTFDRVVMNPPFENATDIKHIMHAFGMLKPGGKLVALCANGPRQREKLQPLASMWEDLPANTFESQGTRVNVALLVMEKGEE